MGEIIGVDLHFVQMFGWLTLAMYIVNELRSILENLVEIGVDVPEFLIKGLDVTKKLMEAEVKKED
jgi:phage-related holin